jgi:ABC-type antimicrobial peptide transport system permease subunit
VRSYTPLCCHDHRLYSLHDGEEVPQRHARYRIIGIVGDVLINLADHPRPTMYLPLFEGARTDFFALLYTNGSPASLSPAVREATKSLDPDIPPFKIRTMAEILGQSSEQRALTAVLFGGFAGLALTLSAVGLCGVLAYLITQRVPEIGIRTALGASRYDVCRLVLFEGLRPAFFGLVVGLIAAFGVVRALPNLLFEVSAIDTVTFVVVPFTLMLIALLACTLPALRAAQLDPAQALRIE